MVDINLEDAAARLCQLIDRAIAGETIRILKDGKPIANLIGIPQPGPRKPIDFKAIRALTSTLPPQEESTRDLIRRMRDETGIDALSRALTLGTKSPF